jgi:PAS domain S-box-containing protein
MSEMDRRSNSRRREDIERDRLFELSLDLLAVVGFDGKFRQANAAWQTVTGVAASALYERPLLECIHEKDRARVAEHLERLRAADGRATFECRWLPASGPPRWLSWTAVSEAAFEAVYVAAHDIMGRKLAEAERSRLAAIVESSGDAIVSASLKGQIESWNPAAERIFGYRASEVLGRPVSLLLARGSGQPNEPPAEAAAEQVVERRRKDGSLVTVSLTVSPVKDAAGNVVATSIIARKVTA